MTFEEFAERFDAAALAGGRARIKILDGVERAPRWLAEGWLEVSEEQQFVSFTPAGRIELAARSVTELPRLELARLKEATLMQLVLQTAPFRHFVMSHPEAAPWGIWNEAHSAVINALETIANGSRSQVLQLSAPAPGDLEGKLDFRAIAERLIPWELAIKGGASDDGFHDLLRCAGVPGTKYLDQVRTICYARSDDVCDEFEGVELECALHVEQFPGGTAPALPIEFFKGLEHDCPTWVHLACHLPDPFHLQPDGWSDFANAIGSSDLEGLTLATCFSATPSLASISSLAEFLCARLGVPVLAIDGQHEGRDAPRAAVRAFYGELVKGTGLRRASSEARSAVARSGAGMYLTYAQLQMYLPPAG